MIADLIVLLVLMFIFARHEAEWEPTNARSGFYFWYLNPKAVLIFLPQFILCRVLMIYYPGPGQILILILFSLPLAPLLHRFFYVSWQRAFTISGCFVLYMAIVAVLIYRDNADMGETRETQGIEQFLPGAEGSNRRPWLQTAENSCLTAHRPAARQQHPTATSRTLPPEKGFDRGSIS